MGYPLKLCDHLHLFSPSSDKGSSPTACPRYLAILWKSVLGYPLPSIHTSAELISLGKGCADNFHSLFLTQTSIPSFSHRHSINPAFPKGQLGHFLALNFCSKSPGLSLTFPSLPCLPPPLPTHLFTWLSVTHPLRPICCLLF